MSLWQSSHWGYREGSAIVLGIGGVGLLLQLAIGPVPTHSFTTPLSWMLGVVMLLALAVWAVLRWRARRRGSSHFSYPAGHVATLSSIGGLLGVLLIMGLTKQIGNPLGHPQLTDPIHLLGFSTVLSAWYFILLYLYLLFVLGCVTIERLFRFRCSRRDFAFVLNHLGLFVALLFGLIASADLQKYRMQVYTDAEYPEWRAQNEETHQQEDLPIALDLLAFRMTEHPPKLMLINRLGNALPLGRPEHILLEKLPVSAELDGWHIEALEHLPYSAAVVTDSAVTFKEWRSRGAVHAAYVRVTHPLELPKGKEGWISAGSYLMPYRGLPLTDSLTLVMAEPEAKQYQSIVKLYAENRDVDSATIEVNKPLRYRDWYIYQLSYDVDEGRWSKMSEFSLVRDPWLGGVYLGIGMLLLGALMLFLTPIKDSHKVPSP